VLPVFHTLQILEKQVLAAAMADRPADARHEHLRAGPALRLAFAGRDPQLQHRTGDQLRRPVTADGEIDPETSRGNPMKFFIPILVTALAASPAIAAPFCVELTGFPLQCMYVDPGQCQHEADRLGGICASNPTEFTTPVGGMPFCTVESGNVPNCVYADRRTCSTDSRQKERNLRRRDAGQALGRDRSLRGQAALLRGQRVRIAAKIDDERPSRVREMLLRRPARRPPGPRNVRYRLSGRSTSSASDAVSRAPDVWNAGGGAPCGSRTI